MSKSVLVAIDGSVYSSNALDYLINIFGNDSELHVHLLSIVPGGSGGKEWMLDVDPLREESPALEMRTAKAKRYLKSAQERLSKNGFSADKISYSAVPSSGNIATTLHHEANQGTYDSILTGRRGIGTVGAMFMGSTSGELIEKCHEVPIWILDGKVDKKGFLLAVHARPESLMSADHLGYILKGHSDAKIYLYHSNAMFGGQPPCDPGQFHSQWGKKWCEKYLDIKNNLFHAHTQVLVDNGIPKSSITQLPAQMHVDIGSDLLRQAQKHNCGTVVIGRRGRQEGKGLLKGVSSKTVKQAEDIAVWLVG